MSTETVGKLKSLYDDCLDVMSPKDQRFVDELYHRGYRQDWQLDPDDANRIQELHEKLLE